MTQILIRKVETLDGCAPQSHVHYRVLIRRCNSFIFCLVFFPSDEGPFPAYQVTRIISLMSANAPGSVIPAMSTQSGAASPEKHRYRAPATQNRGGEGFSAQGSAHKTFDRPGPPDSDSAMCNVGSHQDAALAWFAAPSGALHALGRVLFCPKWCLIAQKLPSSITRISGIG